MGFECLELAFQKTKHKIDKILDSKKKGEIIKSNFLRK
jgi:hypothetical protein